MRIVPPNQDITQRHDRPFLSCAYIKSLRCTKPKYSQNSILIKANGENVLYRGKENKDNTNLGRERRDCGII